MYDTLALVCVVVGLMFLGWLFGTQIQIDAAERNERLLEEAHKWAASQGYVPPADYSSIFRPAIEDETVIEARREQPSEDVIPADRVLVSTTINHKTGEIVEKWKAK